VILLAEFADAFGELFLFFRAGGEAEDEKARREQERRCFHGRRLGFRIKPASAAGFSRSFFISPRNCAPTSAVHDAVVAAEADPHALAGDDLALVIDDGGFPDAADADDRGLRRIDDGGEVIDAGRRRGCSR